MAWSATLSQKLTSNIEIALQPSVRYAIPMSDMLSQARKFSSSRRDIRARCFNPLSVTETQKLRLIDRSELRPWAMCRSASSDKRWQSCRPRYSRAGVPSAVSLLSPAR
uniref:Uncharacterized protein n=1 Tax=Anopheles culicifacies TaxID=139723 RepID=A0A182LWK7_9DIPT